MAPALRGIRGRPIYDDGMSRVPFVSTTWREGRLWDLWMVVHFLSGLWAGLANGFIALAPLPFWLVTLAALAAWEVLEYAAGVREQAENRVIDVAIGLLGAYLGTAFTAAVDARLERSAFGVVTMVAALAGVIGWKAHRRRRSPSSPRPRSPRGTQRRVER